MKNKVIASSHNDNSVSVPGLCDFGFTRKRHMQAMSAGQELLNRADTAGTSIYDSLNCGKLTYLIRYLKKGSVFALLWISYYSEYVSLT